MKKRVKHTVLLLLLGMFAAMAVFPAEAKAVSFTAADFVTLSNMNQYEQADAVDSRQVISTGTKDIKTYYLQLNLKQDSWVYFTGSYSFNNHDGAGTDVAIYSNSALTNKKGEFGWGYWRYNHEFADFFNAGTYYVSVSTNQENFEDFIGNVNIMAVAVPVSNIFNVTTKPAANKTSVTVSFNNVLGQYLDYVEYQKGAVGLSNVYDSAYWQNRIYKPDLWSGNEKAVILKPSGETYSFKATANAKYTIMIQTTVGEKRYSKTISVTGIDKTKPVVKGVKNKKTYKKAVKITFSDKGSGIKKATLNGKKIKSGKKVKKKGSYTLKVWDKAGNLKTIKFKLK
ncbi:MAG: hypothetical protein NC300_05030 [Bacteroidales bacterium]|nr:hypothetical protein [Clostridium sp.]MCM1203486.1 hypothetical protein [Bacteroidales bacterium]